MNPGNSNVGWRLRTLWQRRKLTLVEIARASGLDVSYLSRLERDALQHAKPKPDTINRVLDAMGATIEEREAVYHIERRPLTVVEIDAAVRDVAAEEEDLPEATFLVDEHWFIHYYNRTARAALGLTPEEYRRAEGSHMLHVLVDPAQPRYSRLPDSDRKRTFGVLAEMFKLHFAGEEFDCWYQEVLAPVRRYPWALEIWENPALVPGSRMFGRDQETILNPNVGPMRFLFQLNRLMLNPRFFLANWTPADTGTADLVALVRSLPDYAYPVVPGAGVQGGANESRFGADLLPAY